MSRPKKNLFEQLYEEFKKNEDARDYFGRKLQAFRVRHGMKIEQLADMLRMRDRLVIYQWEIGQVVPRPDKLSKIKRIMETFDAASDGIPAQEIIEALSRPKKTRLSDGNDTYQSIQRPKRGGGAGDSPQEDAGSMRTDGVLRPNDNVSGDSEPQGDSELRGVPSRPTAEESRSGSPSPEPEARPEEGTKNLPDGRGITGGWV